MNIVINETGIYADSYGKLVRFEDQYATEKLIFDLIEEAWEFGAVAVEYKHGTYPCPSDHEIVIEDTCKWHGNKDACANETCWDLKECQKNPLVSIARLVKRKEVNSAHGYTEGSEVPGQFKKFSLYDEALDDAEKCIKELLAQKYGLLNENQFYLLDSKEGDPRNTKT